MFDKKEEVKLTLYQMAQEYRANVRLLELRLLQLEHAKRRARQLEVKYRLKQRAGLLRGMINESRKTVFELEHYYERGGRNDETRRAV